MWWRYHSKWKPHEQSNPFTWYSELAIARAEIALQRQVTHRHAVARMFFTGLRNYWCTLPWSWWIRMVNLVAIPFKMKAAGAIKSHHVILQICYCSCWDSFAKTGYTSSCRCSYFFHRLTKLLVLITINMVNKPGKSDGDTIQNGSQRSNQIPSPGMVNLLLLVLIFHCKDRLAIIMPFLVFFLTGLQNCWCTLQ